MDLGVLRPGETDEYIRGDDSAFRHDSEEEQARKAMASAEVTANAALLETERARNGRSRVPRQERLRRLAAARSRLNAAKAALRELKRRGDLTTEYVRGTWDYQRGKRDYTAEAFCCDGSWSRIL